MSSGTSTPSAQQPDSKPRVTNACEACRASKVKCIASSQLGICQRCLESKRECFFKTGPRTRRPRQSKQNKLSATPVVPPPPAPPKTFTIDIPLAMEEDPNDIYDSLREAHEQYIDDLLPKDSAEHCPYAGSLLHSTSSAATPSSSNSTRPISSFAGQPQFNIESATQLLEAFRKMQPYFPLISLPEGADVASLAKDRPFELLAILASATGSKSLQGHSLYDEEFRKILALKFVAGGERTLDLLLGLLIYCAWYPFHLRPRSKQLTQYLRMATDIVHDLELDQQPEEDQFVQPTIDEERSRGLRAYLGCFYLVSGRANMWSKQTSMPFTPWTAACCEMLENAALLPSDRAFTWMIRFQHMNEGVMGLRKLEKDASQDEYQIKLLVKGMESQIREWTGKISREVSSTVTLTLCRLFTETFLYGAPLLKFPTPRSASGVVEVIDVQRLVQAVSPLQQFLDRCVSLPLSEFGNFCSLDWGRLICSIILCFRLSFPLEKCPQWNATAFRQRVNFEYYLSRLCQDDEGSTGHQSLTPTTARTADVRSASQVILEVVRRKFQKRMELLMAAPPSAQPISSANLDRTMKGCPVLDGSLDQYFQVWDETFVDPSMVMPAASDEKSANPPTGQPAVFHDLWATMTMSWADDGSNNMDMNFGSQ